MVSVYCIRWYSFDLLLCGIVLIYYYNVILSLFSVPNKRRLKKKRSYNREKKESFLVLIPCHNEEEVIGENIKRLYESTYEKKYYTVCIIADNCSDATEAVSQACKMKYYDMQVIILQVSGGSKPKAINSALKILRKNGDFYDYDNIVFLDADNKSSDNMLKSLNYYHQWYPILQCRILSENSNTLVSGGFKSSFENMRHSFQLARDFFGLSGSLCGTGFSVKRELFDEIGFDKCTSLTEDLEFSIMAILKGYKVKYIDDEYVLNQNLEDFKPSIKQSIRWGQGTSYVCKKYSKCLIKAFIKEPSWQLFDTFIFLTCPKRNLIYLMNLMLIFLFGTIPFKLFLILDVIGMLYQILFTLYINEWDFYYFIPQCLYTIEMSLIIPYSYMTKKNQKWIKTKHKRIR